MWALGKVIKTPEVMRVYIGSFWDQPLHNTENQKLFEDEMTDLLTDLHSLPRNNAMRKVNELVKRARLAKVHAFIIGHLKSQMPSMFGKEKKQKKLIANLPEEFNKVRIQYQLPVSDFPNVQRFSQQLEVADFVRFPKLNMRLIDEMEQVLSVDIPNLLRRFPLEPEQAAVAAASVAGNPFAQASPFAPAQLGITWMIGDQDMENYARTFATLNPQDGKVNGAVVRPLFLESQLPSNDLMKIWALSDIDRDASLDLDEFAVASYLVHARLAGEEIPNQLPESLIPASKRIYFPDLPTMPSQQVHK